MDDMERAARVVNSSKNASKILADEDLARAVWPAAVGKVIAGHTGRMRMVRSTLVVEVADAMWQKQLFGLSRQILDRVQNATGSKVITDIEFRIGIPRREPQRADGSRNPLFESLPSSDEADQIRDPVLKKVYRLSRKRATA
jgi:predicted nucleic acid-binding Zn ribbon protein